MDRGGSALGWWREVLGGAAVLVVALSGCSLSSSADCTTDQDCGAEHRCVSGGGLLLSGGGVCVKEQRDGGFGDDTQDIISGDVGEDARDAGETCSSAETVCADGTCVDLLLAGCCSAADCGVAARCVDYRCASPVQITAPDQPGQTARDGLTIRWENDAIPTEGATVYDLEYSRDGGASWEEIVAGWGVVNTTADGQQVAKTTSVEASSHVVPIAVPRVARVVEAAMVLSPSPAPATTTRAGRCKLPLSNPNLLTDAQVFDSSLFAFAGCDNPPYGDELVAFTQAGHYLTVREEGVGLNEVDVTVDLTTYRQQSNGVEAWSVSISADNSSWSRCGDLIPGRDGYGAFTRTCGSFTGADLYVRVEAHAVGSNVRNGISAVELSYPRMPRDISIDVGGEAQIDFARAGMLGESERVSGLSEAFDQYRSSNTTDGAGQIDVPVVLSYTHGSIELSQIEVEYTGYYWDTTELVPGGSYRVRVTQTHGENAGAKDISAHDLEVLGDGR